jgi:hypothetical protein
MIQDNYALLDFFDVKNLASGFLDVRNRCCMIHLDSFIDKKYQQPEELKEIFDYFILLYEVCERIEQLEKGKCKARSYSFEYQFKIAGFDSRFFWASRLDARRIRSCSGCIWHHRTGGYRLDFGWREELVSRIESISKFLNSKGQGY